MCTAEYKTAALRYTLAFFQFAKNFAACELFFTKEIQVFGVFWAVLINTGTTDASSFGNIGQLFNPTFGHTETHH